MGEVMHTVKGTVLTEGTAGMVESACAAVQRFTPKCSEKNCRFSIMSEWMNEYNNRHSTIRPSNVRQCSLNECMSERMDE